MKAFILAMLAMIGISVVAVYGLETIEMSAEQINSTGSVRLN